MVRMGAVWDSTVEVLSGRGSMVARIAALTLFLPALLQEVVPAAFASGAGAQVINVTVGILFIVASLFGTLALTAAASDPTIDEQGAYRIAGAALPATIGAVSLIVAVFALALTPGMVLLVSSGFDLEAAAANVPQENVSTGALSGFALYLIVFGLFAIWAGARLILLYAAIVNERVGVGAIRRSFALTRGLTWRIIGVIILYLIVVSVAVLAVQTVTGLIFRLALGAEQQTLAAVLTGIAVSVVTAGFGVLQPVFAARLYAAVRAEREAFPSP